VLESQRIQFCVGTSGRQVSCLATHSLLVTIPSRDFPITLFSNKHNGLKAKKTLNWWVKSSPIIKNIKVKQGNIFN